MNRAGVFSRTASTLRPQRSGLPGSRRSTIDRANASRTNTEAKRKAAKVEAARRAAAATAAEACGQKLKELAGDGSITFRTNQASIQPSAFATLDQIAATAKSCPDVRIAISGHTDSLGSAAVNQNLSLLRAEAVADYLVKSGVERSRLGAVGYGATKPIAPNNTHANRARNRRIEFDVR